MVTVLSAQHLPTLNRAAASVCDPYVRVFLLPAKKPSFTTKLLHNTANPQFDETFTFDVSIELLID